MNKPTNLYKKSKSFKAAKSYPNQAEEQVMNMILRKVNCFTHHYVLFCCWIKEPLIA